jgi:hypothetical protein
VQFHLNCNIFILQRGRSIRAEKRAHNYHRRRAHVLELQSRQLARKESTPISHQPGLIPRARVCHWLCCFSPFLICSSDTRVQHRKRGPYIFPRLKYMHYSLRSRAAQQNVAREQSCALPGQNKLYAALSRSSFVFVCWRVQRAPERQRKRDALLFFSAAAAAR